MILPEWLRPAFSTHLSHVDIGFPFLYRKGKKREISLGTPPISITGHAIEAAAAAAWKNVCSGVLRIFCPCALELEVCRGTEWLHQTEPSSSGEYS